MGSVVCTGHSFDEAQLSRKVEPMYLDQSTSINGFVAKLEKSDVSKMIVEQHIYLKQEAARKSQEIRKSQDLQSDQPMFPSLDIASAVFEDPSENLNIETRSKFEDPDKCSEFETNHQAAWNRTNLPSCSLHLNASSGP